MVPAESPVTLVLVPPTLRSLYPGTKLAKLLTVETSRRYSVALVTADQLAVKEEVVIEPPALAVGAGSIVGADPVEELPEVQP
jgi:hypothetical protein